MKSEMKQETHTDLTEIDIHQKIMIILNKLKNRQIARKQKLLQIFNSM